MDVVAPTNTTLDHIAQVILSADTICVCGHVNPDGDCIGSVLALASALRSLNKHVYPLCVENVDQNRFFQDLPGSEHLIKPSSLSLAPELFISVDVSNDERLGTAADTKASASHSIIIDHHVVEGVDADLAYIVPSAPSTTMLIWDLIEALGVERTKEIATCCFFGLMTDTGGFRHANSSKEAFEYAAAMVERGANAHMLSDAFFQRRSFASVKLEERLIERIHLFCDDRAALSFVTQADLDALGATKADCEPLIDVLRSLDGVKISCILKAFDGAVRGSLRSKDGIDVNAIARKLGGGGHKLASGFTLDCPLEDAIVQVERLIEDACN